MFHLLTNIPQFYEPSINQNFVCIFSKYINKYQRQSEALFNSCHGENSIMVNESLVSYFPCRVYNGIDDLAEIIMNPANCLSSTVNLSPKDNFNLISSSNAVFKPVVNCHTITYKPITPADNPALLEFHCSDHIDYYVDLNSVLLLILVKLSKTDASDIEGAVPNTVACVNKLLHSMFSSLSISLSGKPVTLNEINYHYKAYFEMLLTTVLTRLARI